MSAAHDPAAEVAALEATLAERRAHVLQLREELRARQEAHAALLDQLGTDEHGKPLRVAPLLWALAGALAVLALVCLTYILGLLVLRPRGVDADARSFVPFVLALPALAGLSLFFSRRPGAGGSARALLRGLTWVLLPLCLATIIPLLAVAYWRLHA